ncbi:MAG TPA: ATP-binding protein, partial [Solirubrobacteraceae bacterium]|nr:ATP-binding protein [Solirubrobacteraceae bacterium]
MSRGGDTLELVGREDELRVLAEVADALAAGTSRIVLIEGASGTGKSSLLSELRGLASDRGVRVAGAAAIELDRDIPFGVVGRIVGADGREVGSRRSLAALAEGGLASVHAMVGAATELIGDGGLLVWLDDAQWADDQSLRVIATLAGLSRELPLTIAVSWRRAELPDHHLRALPGLEHSLRLTLGDLDRERSRELVGGLI